jgi:hypothetical protein
LFIVILLLLGFVCCYASATACLVNVSAQCGQQAQPLSTTRLQPGQLLFKVSPQCGQRKNTFWIPPEQWGQLASSTFGRRVFLTSRPMITRARISSTNPNPDSHQKDGQKLQLSQVPPQYIFSTPDDRSQQNGCAIGLARGYDRSRSPDGRIPRESGSFRSEQPAVESFFSWQSPQCVVLPSGNRKEDAKLHAIVLSI